MKSLQDTQYIKNKRKKLKLIYGFIAFLLLILCVLLSYVYRPYVYSHHINDYHIADCYTSFLGVPIIVFLTQAFRKEKWSIPTNIFYATVFLIGWEIVDGFLAKQYDWIDIIACIFSGVILYVIHRITCFKSIYEYDG